MIDKITRKLVKVYAEKPHRLKHVFGVRDTAVSLGKKYNLDVNKLEIAALLHDITKYYSHEKNVKIIQEEYPNHQDILYEYNPSILHAFSAVHVARTEYDIEDLDILRAISSHTIGRPEMNMYEKVLFISDYVEPGRTYESCIRVREILKESLDKAIYTAIHDSIMFHERANAVIPKTAYRARDYYKKVLEEQDGKNSSTN